MTLINGRSRARVDAARARLPGTARPLVLDIADESAALRARIEAPTAVPLLPMEPSGTSPLS